MDLDRAETQTAKGDWPMALTMLLPAIDGRAYSPDPLKSEPSALDVVVPTSPDGDIALDAGAGALSSTAAADQEARRLEAVILTIIFAVAVGEVIAIICALLG